MPLVETPNEPLAPQSPIAPNFNSAPLPVADAPGGRGKKLALIIVAVLLLVAGATAYWLFLRPKAGAPATTNTANTAPAPATPPVQKAPLLTLDPKKNYGNKYESGVLPVGDSKYVTAGAKKGYVYMCNANFVPAGQAGAQTRGPWFTNNNTQWDSTQKVSIQGHITWQKNMSVTVQNGKRVITTHDLPDHFTGVFPVALTDPARNYDANPNSIKEQSLTYTLVANPAAGSTAHCMGGEVGVMLSGVALFNAFDAGGRDAGAWEVQDGCDGHPQSAGEYHYHALSRCISDAGVQTVIGFALDGLPITGPKVGSNNILTTDDLDECHGIVSQIVLDSKQVTTYHYVMTQDFPYSVSCFRATATKPPGQPEGAPGQSKPQPSGPPPPQ